MLDLILHFKHSRSLFINSRSFVASSTLSTKTYLKNIHLRMFLFQFDFLSRILEVESKLLHLHTLSHSKFKSIFIDLYYFMLVYHYYLIAFHFNYLNSRLICKLGLTEVNAPPPPQTTKKTPLFCRFHISN